MPTTDTNVPQVIVNKLTKAQYEAATKSPTEFYVVSDEQIGTSDIADGAVTAAKASFTTYSTSEQVVGTWIDGKSIYRKVVEYTNNATIGATGTVTNVSIPHGISNFSQVLFAKGFRVGASNENFPLPQGGGSTDLALGTFIRSCTTSDITLRIINDTWAAGTWYFVLEYTKTTD